MKDELTQLEEQLHSKKQQDRYQAVYQLAKLDDPHATELLIRTLQSDRDREIRAITVKLLGTLPLTDSTQAAILAAAESDKHSQVRRAAIEVISDGKIPAEDVSDLLYNALDDHGRLVRRAATEALRILGIQRAVHKLIGVLLGDPDHQVRQEAAKALGSLGSLDAVPALEEALVSDTSFYVQYLAARALNALAHPDSAPVMLRVFRSSRDVGLREILAQGLGELLAQVDEDIRYEIIEAMVCALHGYSGVWHAAAESLWAAGEEGIEVALDLLTDSNPRVRQCALRATLWLTAEFDDVETKEFLDEPLESSWGWWN